MRSLRALLAGALLAACATPAPGPAIAIVGGAIVDPDADTAPRTATVIVRGDRVVAVGAQVRAPAGARIVDATGRFLVPGLWDMHAHLAPGVPVGEAPERMVGHGVLAARDCGGDLEALLQARREIGSGARVGPELLIAGPTLNGDRFAPFHRVVRDAAEARAAVRELAAAGVDFVKTHRATSREAFFALAEEAPRHGLYLGGHVPLAVTWEEAAGAGMASMEHVQTLAENEISAGQTPAAGVEAALVRLDGARGDEIFAMLARRGAYLDPTLIAYEQGIAARPELAERRRQAYGAFLRFVGRAHRAGVPMLAGSDMLERHGDMLLLELERLVEAGLTPRQALAAATTNPARLSRRGDLGGIAPGATASFLVVDADPTADVRNVRRLSAVVLRGRLIEAGELARLRGGA